MRKIVYILLLISGECLAQGNIGSLGAWHFTSFSGNVGLRGNYRVQEIVSTKNRDFLSNPYLSGNLGLNTNSYIWHPNFLKLDLGVEYNPGTESHSYLVRPDYSEVQTISRFDLRGYLFSAKSMNLSGNYNFSNSFSNRESISHVKSKRKSWGLGYSYKNTKLPVTINYQNSKWNQREIETNRASINERRNLDIKAIKSFGLGDKSKLCLTRNNYRRDQYGYVTNVINTNLLFNNHIYFDEKKKYLLNSSISNMMRAGTINQNRFRVYEKSSFKLPWRLRLIGNYKFSNVVQEKHKLIQNSIGGNLGHMLYESLRTNLYYDYFVNNQLAYKRHTSKAGVTLNYTKKIPKGTLNLSYHYLRQVENQNSKESFVTVFDEQHTLIDGEIVLLDKPNVTTSSVRVKDVSGAIIYQENFDYVLVKQGSFLEIQRVPGGQIANSDDVLLDYISNQVGSFRYISNYNNFYARLNLFSNLLNMYYTHSYRRYVGMESTDLVTLNPFNRHLVGIRIEWDFISGGAEYEDYKSNIVPFKKMRYYIQMNTWVGRRLMFSLNGNLTNITLSQSNTERLYLDVNGNIMYKIRGISSVNMDLGYRNQTGEQIDLDLFSAKVEYNTLWRNLYLKIGSKVYRRHYVTSEVNFGEVYFQIDRRF